MNLERILFGSFFVFLIFLSGCTTSPAQNTYYKGTGSENIFTPTPNLDAKIVGCNTNLGFGGETTTVYVTLTNTGSAAAEDVTVTFHASDSDEKTPVKVPIGILPAGKKRTISYAIDTRFGVQTTAQVLVNAKNTNTITDYSADCRKLDETTAQNLDRLVQLGLQVY